MLIKDTFVVCVYIKTFTQDSKSLFMFELSNDNINIRFPREVCILCECANCFH